jgi:DNA polymerase-3 subunit delta'
MPASATANSGWHSPVAHRCWHSNSVPRANGCYSIPCSVSWSRGKGLNAVLAAAIVDKAVKAEKRPAPLKRALEWAQKWLFDLTLASQGLPPRYFVAHAPQLLRLAQGTDARKLLAFNRKAIQYKAQCEQPVNSRLFLEEFFLNYVRLF